MQSKLILRNVSRSIKNYLIYMVTLVISVGLFYGFLSISSRYYNSYIPVEYDMNLLQTYLKLPIMGITAILLFLIGYVNNFLIKRSLKEFALQSLLGMEKSKIAWMFFVETLIIGIVSVLIGIVLGSIFSQIITAIIVEAFGAKFQIFLPIFPDTIGITILVFTGIFMLIGIFNVISIRKIKIIDMLSANKENKDDLKKEFLMPIIVTAGTVLSMFQILLWYFMQVFNKANGFINNSVLDRISNTCNVLFPLLFFLMVFCFLLYHVFCSIRRIEKKISFKIFSFLLGLISICNSISAFSVVEDFPHTDMGLKNWFFYVGIGFIVFFLFSFFYSLSTLFHLLRTNSKKWKYEGNHLFILGQINARLVSTSKTMGFIATSLLIAITCFMLEPVLNGWFTGFLDNAAVYDVQLINGYRIQTDKNDLKELDFSYVADYLKEQGCNLSDYANVHVYFANEGEFKKGVYSTPLMVIGVSEFNHLVRMAGQEEISVTDGTYSIQWGKEVKENLIKDYFNDAPDINVLGKTLRLNPEGNYKIKMGEYITAYGGLVNKNSDEYQGICIVPDECTKGLLVGETLFCAMFKEKISYEKTTELEQQILLKAKEIAPSTTRTDIRMRTIQENSSISVTLIAKMLMLYGGVILFVICFTILSLQQLADSFDFKERFNIIRKLGTSEEGINRIILTQMVVWFGMPILMGSLSAAGIIWCYISSFSNQISIYIADGVLAQSFGIVSVSIFVLFICYFSATWYLFKKNIANIRN